MNRNDSALRLRRSEQQNARLLGPAMDKPDHSQAEGFKRHFQSSGRRPLEPALVVALSHTRPEDEELFASTDPPVAFAAGRQARDSEIANELACVIEHRREDDPARRACGSQDRSQPVTSPAPADAILGEPGGFDTDQPRFGPLRPRLHLSQALDRRNVTLRSAPCRPLETTGRSRARSWPHTALWSLSRSWMGEVEAADPRADFVREGDTETRAVVLAHLGVGVGRVA